VTVFCGRQCEVASQFCTQRKTSRYATVKCQITQTKIYQITQTKKYQVPNIHQQHNSDVYCNIQDLSFSIPHNDMMDAVQLAAFNDSSQCTPYFYNANLGERRRKPFHI